MTRAKCANNQGCDAVGPHLPSLLGNLVSQRKDRDADTPKVYAVMSQRIAGKKDTDRHPSLRLDASMLDQQQTKWQLH
eukprot:4315083-Karenia_brevis.AAC.1